MQQGLDFYGYFLVDGLFLAGIRDVAFDSAAAHVDVELNEGVDGQTWVVALPVEVLSDTVLTRWTVSRDGCPS
jgi:hypothetical protein